MKLHVKSTRLGRVLCRLAGDQNGAVMMEYVVLAVLLVAAVVGAVIAFGGRITKQFKAAGEATGGQVNTAGQTVQSANTAFGTDMQNAVQNQNTINGGEFNPQGGK